MLLKFLLASLIVSPTIGNSPLTVQIECNSVKKSETLTATKTYECKPQAILQWDAPTTNTDSTPLTDLAGYRIYYGPSATQLNRTIDVGLVTTYTLQLLPGTYYFAVTSKNTAGIESDYSNIVTKTISQ